MCTSVSSTIRSDLYIYVTCGMTKRCDTRRYAKLVEYDAYTVGVGAISREYAHIIGLTLSHMV